MDEIDAIGGKRFSEGTSADREIQRTLMELLNQMDGFDQLGQVKMIMATNRPDVLDPALLRPGRLDRKIGQFRFGYIYIYEPVTHKGRYYTPKGKCPQGRSGGGGRFIMESLPAERISGTLHVWNNCNSLIRGWAYNYTCTCIP